MQDHVRGYAHPGYARSLADIGAPIALARSGGWLLRRDIGGTSHADAMGCYPLFACVDWLALPDDLAELPPGVVSVVVVADPFGDHDPALLERAFPDLVSPFKEHFVVDLSRPPASFVDAHHRRNARKALRLLSVERCPHPPDAADEWVRLYALLVERHGIRGIPAFSRSALAAQLDVPGITVFRAMLDGETVGMVLWYAAGERAYYHLAAYTPLGYSSWASYALFWSAIEHFAGDGLAHLSLGAGAGANASGDDGLTRFKAGWATGTRRAFLCGRICDSAIYAQLRAQRAPSETSYFPAYRAGEFV